MIFVCQTLPKKDVHKFPEISQASANFTDNFISAATPRVTYSLIPLNLKTVKKYEFEHNIQQIQLRIFPHINFLKFINGFIENIYLLYKILSLSKKGETIWYYNVSYHNFISYTILRVLFRRKVFVLLADLYAPEKYFGRNKFMLMLTNAASGIIALSEQFKNVTTNPNFEYLAGITSKFSELKYKEPDFKKFLFAGDLDELLGIDLAVEVFRDLPELTLIITGRGEKETKLKKLNLPNVKFLGFLSFEQYNEILNASDICLSLSDPTKVVNNFKFPSKIIEFMSSGKIVVSTMKYNQLSNDSYVYSPYEPYSLTQAVKKISNFSKFDGHFYMRNAVSFSKNNFSLNAWKNAINRIEGFNSKYL